MKLLAVIYFLFACTVAYCQTENSRTVEESQVQEAFILAAGISGGVTIEPSAEDFGFPLPPGARAIVAVSWRMTGTEIWLELPNPTQKSGDDIINDYAAFISSDETWKQEEDIWCRNGNALIGITYQNEGLPDSLYASYGGPYFDYSDEYKTVISIRMNSWSGMSFCQSRGH